MKIFIRTIMCLVALAAAALSFQSLMHLAELCGYGQLSWAYPLTVDLGAAASCAEWFHARNRQALGMTWAMLAISVVLNGTVHYLTAQGSAPGWLLVVLVAAVPPAVFGLVVHLGWSKTQAETSSPSPEKAPTPEQAAPKVQAAPARPIAPARAQAPKRTPAAPPTDLTDRAREVVAASDGPVGRGQLAKALKVSPYQARLALEQLSMNGHSK